MAEDKPLKYEPIALNGRLITSVDPTQLGKGDFQALENMRYTNAAIKSIKGMTKINTSAIAKPRIGAAYHFMKDEPAESHLLAQGIAVDGSSALYDHTTAIPAQGAFASLFTETSNCDDGQFSPAPDGCIAYGNGKELVIWSGNETRCAGFYVTDNLDETAANESSEIYDYTDNVNDANTATTAIVKQDFIQIASVRPLKGIKFYVQTPNTSAYALTLAFYWGSSGWTSLTNISDGTAVAGKTLAQTGVVSFDSTVANSKPRYFHNIVAYWYLFYFSGVDATTAISRCTLDAPIQPVADLWDGVPRKIAAAEGYSGELLKRVDIGPQIVDQDFISSATTTYTDVVILAKTTNDLLPDDERREVFVGFTSRMMGLKIYINEYYSGMDGPTEIDYWSGLSWVALTVNDQTFSNGRYLAKTGVVYWSPPASSLEMQTSITGQDLFYFYRISAGVAGNYLRLDCIEGIPAPEEIETYKFPAMFQNRLVLCSNQSDAVNSILIGGANSSCVFNGTDSTKLYFGDNREIMAAVPFFSRYSDALYESLLVLKADSVWIVNGTSPDDYSAFRVASMYGCSAPGTLTSCDIAFSVSEGGGARNVVIWQTSSSIVMWDGSTVFPIDEDIRDIFDQTKSYAIDLSMMSKSKAFYDEELKEWHWLYASKDNTTLNKEMVFDVVRKKWFTVNRGTGNYLQLGVGVIDTNNNKYVYGANTTGYIERLENGTTFDGTAITSFYHTGDIPIGGWMNITSIRKIKPINSSKNTTTNDMSLAYFGDCATSATKTLTFDVADSTHRIVQKLESIHEGDFIFHSFKCSMTTSDESICFEPIGIGLFYKDIREDVKR